VSISIIGAPLDLGAGRRGVDMGPSALRLAGMADRLRSLGLDVEDLGNVGAAVAETAESDDRRAHFLPAILAACEELAGRVSDVVAGGGVPLVLGGDHSIAIGTLGGLAAAAGGPGAAIWIDAHGDLNTPDTSPSGNVHGMPLAAALGLGGDAFASERWPLPAVDRERVSLVGIRSLDAGERDLVRAQGLAVHTTSEIDRRGMEAVMREALERAAGAAFVHVSLDLDALDPDVAPGVGTPVRGGLTYREAHLAMELVAESGLLTSFEVVEVNPTLDRANATAALAVELTASAFGERTL
jgi:arginase